MSPDEEIEIRRSLLDYFSSELTSHGSLTLSVILSVFAFLEITTRLSPICFWITFLIFGALMTALLYMLVRILFWGYAATNIIALPPIDSDETLFVRYFKSAIKLPDKAKGIRCFLLKYCSKPKLAHISFLATFGFLLSLIFLFAFGIYPSFIYEGILIAVSIVIPLYYSLLSIACK